MPYNETNSKKVRLDLIFSFIGGFKTDAVDLDP